MYKRQVQHYTKLTPKVAAALADKYQSDILTDDEIHSGVINYLLIYLGTEPVGYFALDLGPCLLYTSLPRLLRRLHHQRRYLPEHPDR